MQRIHHKGLLRDPKLAAHSHSPFSERTEPRKGLRRDSPEKIDVGIVFRDEWIDGAMKVALKLLGNGLLGVVSPPIAEDILSTVRTLGIT